MTARYEAPYTISRYLDAVAADLAQYFPGLPVSVAGGVGAADTPGDHIRVRANRIGAFNQDAMSVEIQAELWYTGTEAVDVAAQLYAWCARRTMIVPGYQVEITAEGYERDRNTTLYIATWQLILPNDYTLRPLPGDGHPVREITITLSDLRDQPLGEVTVP